MNKPNYYAIIPANVRYDKDLSPNAKLLYGEITALSNAEGFCWATNAYFAGLYGMSTRHTSRMISQLNDKGFIVVEIINEFERKIYINIPHDKSVQPPTPKKSKGQDEKVQPPHDRNVYKNNTSINNTINITSNNKNNSANSPEFDREFEQLWKIYPRKLGKKKAFDSYKKARKIKKIPYETIENGLYKYIDYIKARETDEQFIQHASTWFNQEKWQDDYISATPQKKAKSPLDLYKMEFGGNENEFRGNSQVYDHYQGGLPEFL